MQKRYECVKLHFSSPLHLSRGREYYDESTKVLHSDTIASALFVAAMQLDVSPEIALAMLDECRLSSAFPFVGVHHFFPKPLVHLPFTFRDVSEDRLGKQYKKIQYLSQHWFEHLLAGEFAVIESGKHIADGSSFLGNVAIAKPYKDSVIQRVTIPRNNQGDPMPFFTERLFFHKDSGLFVLIERNEKSNYQDLFRAAFRLLGDLGVGTDRSVGNGFFKPEFSELILHIPDTADWQCNLGLYLPKKGELSDQDIENSAWILTKRGGYMAGAAMDDHKCLRKKSVYMFQEGSIVPNKPLLGERVDMSPTWNGLQHPVWREGRPIFVPIVKVEAI